MYTIKEVCSPAQIKLVESKGYDYDPKFFELYEEKNVKEFTKDMLTTGMRVVHRNGEVGIVLKDISVLSYRNDEFNKLDDYENDLTQDLGCDYEEWDIIKVYDGYQQHSLVLNHEALGNIIWERIEETPQQAQIRELQDTIKKAQAQLNELQKGF